MTPDELRAAKKTGALVLQKTTLFYLWRRAGDDQLKRPRVLIRAGTLVAVEKVCQRGAAALLKYTDRSGKVWWSWMHSTIAKEKQS